MIGYCFVDEFNVCVMWFYEGWLICVGNNNCVLICLIGV